MRRIMIAAGLALSGVLLAGGCQLVGGGDGNKKQTGKEAAPSAAASSQAAPAASSSAPPAVKSFTYPAIAPGGEVTVGFQRLQVRGQLAQLSLTWTPNVPGNNESWHISQMTSGTLVGGGEIDLVDTQNLKRYVIVKDPTATTSAAVQVIRPRAPIRRRRAMARR